jgi:hypothetical protein
MPNAGFLSFFMTLPALRNTNQVFCRLCVYWNSLAVFHTIKLGSGFWQEVTGMRYRYCPLHKEYLSSTWPTIHDVDLSPQRHFLSNFPFAHIFSPSSTLFRHILHINPGLNVLVWIHYVNSLLETFFNLFGLPGLSCQSVMKIKESWAYVPHERNVWPKYTVNPGLDLELHTLRSASINQHSKNVYIPKSNLHV